MYKLKKKKKLSVSHKKPNLKNVSKVIWSLAGSGTLQYLRWNSFQLLTILAKNFILDIDKDTGSHTMHAIKLAKIN